MRSGAIHAGAIGERAGARRAMTLLELIVAVTVLASLMGVVATIWGQMSAWSREAGAEPSALRLQRISEFARRQWDDRRLAVSLEEKADVAVRLGNGRFEFITASPALFPEWPLVRAAYVVEPMTPLAPPGSPMRLVYEELRLTGPGRVQDDDVDALGAVMKRRYILLEECASLRWEVWSSVAMAAAESQAAIDSSGNPPSPWRALGEGELHIATAMIARGAGGQDEPGEAATSASAVAGSASLVDGRRGAEESLIKENHPALRAARLVGEFQGKEFEWLMIAGVSRSSSF